MSMGITLSRAPCSRCLRSQTRGVLIDDRTLTLVVLCLDDLRGLRYRLSNTSRRSRVAGLIDRDAVVEFYAFLDRLSSQVPTFDLDPFKDVWHS
jgi:hypothetical protein